MADKETNGTLGALPPISNGSLTAEQVDRAGWIAESRGIDLETARELVYLRDKCAAAPIVAPVVDAMEAARRIVFTDFQPTRGAISFDVEASERLIKRIAAALTDSVSRSAIIEKCRELEIKFNWQVAGDVITGLRQFVQSLPAPASTVAPVEQSGLRKDGFIEHDLGDKVIVTRAAPASPAAIRDASPTFGYERALTSDWETHNARRHELIEARRSRLLSEAEITELAELQWLAGIKRALASGPIATPSTLAAERTNELRNAYAFAAGALHGKSEHAGAALYCEDEACVYARDLLKRTAAIIERCLAGGGDTNNNTQR